MFKKFIFGNAQQLRFMRRNAGVGVP